jgi:hypothetical protein
MAVGDVERASVAEFLREIGHYKAAWRLERCGGGYIRVRCKFCSEEARVRFTCNVRLCRDCVRVQSKLALRKILVALMWLQKEGRLKKGWTWKLLTLTTRREGSERERVRLLKKEFRNLWLRYYAHVKGVGCFYAIEIGNGGNVHLHAVMYVPFVEREEIKRYWEKRTGAYIVDIRAVRFGLHHVAAYVVKYMLKETEGDINRLVSNYIAVYGLRRVGAKGIFYGVKVVEEKRSVCILCGQWDGWIIVVPFALEPNTGVPILTIRRWRVEFG